MLLHIPGVFTRDEVGRIREALEQADWADGKITAGYQSAKAKHNPVSYTHLTLPTILLV